ncbi:MAG: tetratricopeptide repeat protein [Planctomycetales bacterium]
MADSPSGRPPKKGGPPRPGKGPPGKKRSGDRPSGSGRSSGSGRPGGKPRLEGKFSAKKKHNKPWLSTSLLNLKNLGQNRFAFEAPECAIERDLDLAEVRDMILRDEQEIARDELLYLVADCRGFLEAYCVMAEQALEEGDIALAKGHFGFAYENGLDALPRGFKGSLPSKEGYNSHFFHAGRGLARCLIAKGDLKKGREVLEQLRRFDPEEPQTLDLIAQLKERIAQKNASKPPQADS